MVMTFLFSISVKKNDLNIKKQHKKETRKY